jgi:hypothetical protein
MIIYCSLWHVVNFNKKAATEAMLWDTPLKNNLDNHWLTPWGGL